MKKLILSSLLLSYFFIASSAHAGLGLLTFSILDENPAGILGAVLLPTGIAILGEDHVRGHISGGIYDFICYCCSCDIENIDAQKIIATEIKDEFEQTEADENGVRIVNLNKDFVSDIAEVLELEEVDKNFLIKDLTINQ